MGRLFRPIFAPLRPSCGRPLASARDRTLPPSPRRSPLHIRIALPIKKALFRCKIKYGRRLLIVGRTHRPIFAPLRPSCGRPLASARDRTLPPLLGGLRLRIRIALPIKKALFRVLFLLVGDYGFEPQTPSV